MRAVLGILAAAVVAASPAAAATAAALRICFEDWRPYASVEDGRAAGLMIDIVDRALAVSGRRASYVLQPYPRCIANVRSGAADAILMSSDEAGLVPAPTAVAYWEVGVIARADWPADSFGSLADFAGATVGLVGTYEYHPAIRASRDDWKVSLAADAMFNLRMAAGGRIDATIADLPWARDAAVREGLKLKFLSPTLAATPQYVYFRPDLAATAAELGATLRTMIDDGTVDRLYRDRTGSSFSEVADRTGRALLHD